MSEINTQCGYNVRKEVTGRVILFWSHFPYMTALSGLLCHNTFSFILLCKKKIPEYEMGRLRTGAGLNVAV